MLKRYLHTDMYWGNFRSGPLGSKDVCAEIATLLHLLVLRWAPTDFVPIPPWHIIVKK